MPEAELTHEVDVGGYVGAKRTRDRLPRAARSPTPGSSSSMPDEMFADGVRHGVVHRAGPRAGPAPRLAVRRMTRLYLVRHGRAAAGWDRDPDPDLDELGLVQATGRCRPVERTRRARAARRRSPARCDAAGETAAALVRAVGDRASASRRRSPRSRRPQGVAMVERVEWLRTRWRGTWAELGEPYTTFRDGVVAPASRRSTHDTVVVLSTSSPSTPRSARASATTDS